MVRVTYVRGLEGQVEQEDEGRRVHDYREMRLVRLF